MGSQKNAKNIVPSLKYITGMNRSNTVAIWLVTLPLSQLSCDSWKSNKCHLKKRKQFAPHPIAGSGLDNVLAPFTRARDTKYMTSENEYQILCTMYFYASLHNCVVWRHSKGLIFSSIKLLIFYKCVIIKRFFTIIKMPSQ